MNDKISHIVTQIGAFLYHHSGDRWQTSIGAHGEIISSLWPGTIPFAIHKREKEEFE